MTSKSRQYPRVPRPLESDHDGAAEPERPPPEPGHPPRGRIRRSHFGRRFASTTATLRCAEGDAVVLRTLPFLMPRLPHILTNIEGEMASGERDADEEPAEQERRHAWLARWLELLVIGTMDEEGGERAAAASLAYLRPPEAGPVHARARILLFAIEIARAHIIGALADDIADSLELTAATVAWSRRIATHLDLMLAVYASCERARHWY